MVKLWRVAGYRVKIPNMSDEDFYEIRKDVRDITPASFIEKLELPNHIFLIFPRGMNSAVKNYLEEKGYKYREADVYARTHILKS